MNSNEPVAWMVDTVITYSDDIAQGLSTESGKPIIPLYTHSAKTLTDEEILQEAEWMFGTYFFESIDDPYWIEFARKILTKAQE